VFILLLTESNHPPLYLPPFPRVSLPIHPSEVNWIILRASTLLLQDIITRLVSTIHPTVVTHSPLGPSGLSSKKDGTMAEPTPTPAPLDTSASTSTAPQPTSVSSTNGTQPQAAPVASGSTQPPSNAPRPPGGIPEDRQREMLKSFPAEKIASIKKVCLFIRERY